MTEPTIEEIAEKLVGQINDIFVAIRWKGKYYSPADINHLLKEIKESFLAAIVEATEAQRKEIERLEVIEGQLALQIGALERSNQSLRGVNTSRKEYGERLEKVLKRIKDYAIETSAGDIASMADDAV